MHGEAVGGCGEGGQPIGGGQGVVELVAHHTGGHGEGGHAIGALLGEGEVAVRAAPAIGQQARSRERGAAVSITGGERDAATALPRDGIGHATGLDQGGGGAPSRSGGSVVAAIHGDHHRLAGRGATAVGELQAVGERETLAVSQVVESLRTRIEGPGEGVAGLAAGEDGAGAEAQHRQQLAVAGGQRPAGPRGGAALADTLHRGHHRVAEVEIAHREGAAGAQCGVGFIECGAVAVAALQRADGGVVAANNADQQDGVCRVATG